MKECTAKNSVIDGFDIGGPRNVLEGCVAKKSGGEGFDNKGVDTEVVECTSKKNRIDFSNDGAFSAFEDNSSSDGTSATPPPGEVDLTIARARGRSIRRAIRSEGAAADEPPLRCSVARGAAAGSMTFSRAGRSERARFPQVPVGEQNHPIRGDRRRRRLPAPVLDNFDDPSWGARSAAGWEMCLDLLQAILRAGRSPSSRGTCGGRSSPATSERFEPEFGPQQDAPENVHREQR